MEYLKCYCWCSDDRVGETVSDKVVDGEEEVSELVEGTNEAP